MAAPVGSKLLLLRESNSACIMFRCGKMSIRMVPSRNFTLRHMSQLHKCSRWQVDVKKVATSRQVYGIALVRHASTNTQTDVPPPPDAATGLVPDIPPPPDVATGMVPDDFILNLPELNAIGEPTLRSLGLGSNWPTGLYQKSIEFLHVSADLPWWSTILLTVVVVRLCVFPLILRQQRMMRRWTTYSAQMKKLQAAYDDAKLSQDAIEIMKRQQELNLFMTQNKLSPFKIGMPMMVQMPVFMSVYLGMKKMALLPVESLHDGGFLWFGDLTLTDPFYILPLISAGLLLVNLEIGAETTGSQSVSPMMKWIMRGTTGVFFAFISFQPACCTLYFAGNNIWVTTQAMILRSNWGRRVFNIPAPEPVQTEENKGFVATLKDMNDKRRQKKEIINWRMTDEEQFKKAASGPVPKTYRYNPKAIQSA